jgi:hypothetical protein
MIGDGSRAYTWVHCDRKFTGYFIADYTAEDWEILGQALKKRNTVIYYSLNKFSYIALLKHSIYLSLLNY